LEGAEIVFKTKESRGEESLTGREETEQEPVLSVRQETEEEGLDWKWPWMEAPWTGERALSRTVKDREEVHLEKGRREEEEEALLMWMERERMLVLPVRTVPIWRKASGERRASSDWEEGRVGAYLT